MDKFERFVNLASGGLALLSRELLCGAGIVGKLGFVFVEGMIDDKPMIAIVDDLLVINNVSTRVYDFSTEALDICSDEPIEGRRGLIACEIPTGKTMIANLMKILNEEIEHRLVNLLITSLIQSINYVYARTYINLNERRVSVVNIVNTVTEIEIEDGQDTIVFSASRAINLEGKLGDLMRELSQCFEEESVTETVKQYEEFIMSI